MRQLGEGALGELLRVADSAAADQLTDTLQRVLAGSIREVVLYLSDYEGAELHAAPGARQSRRSARPLKVEGTPAGRSLREQNLVEDPQSQRLWAPILERADPIGVLELEVDDITDEVRRLASEAGIMIGHLLVTARKYTDVYELLRRNRNMNLAAEMHWDILPATCYQGPLVAVCGDLEPAYEVGGDAFDYCINDRTMHVAIIDAMGHGLEAALLSTQAVAAYRFARRRQASLAGTVATIEDALRRQFGGDKFVTGLLIQLDLPDATMEWVTSGHVVPLLVRDGKVTQLSQAPVHCPMGLDLLGEVDGAELSLRKDDRILLYSDGVIEARAPNGEYMELDRLIELVEAADHDESIAILVNGLIDEVVEFSKAPLRDDATIVGFQYLGPLDR
ncbi:MAG TPA: PP2C family protein-serine/threonine phosphatase [Actinomycetota bacterium]|nr:PP2C family protein-serine/threonine phosphatase [Actinomycetota bacterium]